MYELIVIWNSGEKDIFKYSTLERAAQTERGYKKPSEIRYSGQGSEGRCLHDS